MSERLTLANRQRGHANAVRSELVRERVRDALGRLGERHGVSKRTILAREQFIHDAIRVARSRGLRIWADTSFPVEVGAKSSLEILLCEKISTYRGRSSTGVNDSWVLDIWEAVLDYYNRDPLFTIRPEEISVSVETVEDEPFTRSSGRSTVKLSAAKPLSIRALDAFIAKDDETMMQIAVEIDELERK